MHFKKIPKYMANKIFHEMQESNPVTLEKKISNPFKYTLKECIRCDINVFIFEKIPKHVGDIIFQ